MRFCLPSLAACLTGAALAALPCCPAQAETAIALPEGTQEVFRTTAPGTTAKVPIGRYTAVDTPARQVEGEVLTRVWHLAPVHQDTLRLYRAVRPQLEAAGFDILFDCIADGCGGFDFRANIDVVPPPAMRVDLTDFRFVSARRAGSYLMLLFSPGHLQAIEVLADSEPEELALSVPKPLATEASASERIPVANDAAELSDVLATRARAVLQGVGFATGSKTLDTEARAALAPLAEVLKSDPELRVVLVGHTDNAGSLSANIVLSRARAMSARQALIDDYGIQGERLEADGVGFLLPRVPNTSPENRALNRRVEAVVR